MPDGSSLEQVLLINGTEFGGRRWQIKKEKPLIFIEMMNSDSCVRNASLRTGQGGVDVQFVRLSPKQAGSYYLKETGIDAGNIGDSAPLTARSGYKVSALNIRFDTKNGVSWGVDINRSVTPEQTYSDGYKDTIISVVSFYQINGGEKKVIPIDQISETDVDYVRAVAGLFGNDVGKTENGYKVSDLVNFSFPEDLWADVKQNCGPKEKTE